MLCWSWLSLPSVTIAPRDPARGVLSFVVTLTTHQDVRSLESAIKLAGKVSVNDNAHFLNLANSQYDLIID